MCATRRVPIVITTAVCLAVASIATFVFAVAISAADLLSQPSPIVIATGASPPPTAPARPRGCRAGRRYQRAQAASAAARTADPKPPPARFASDASTQTPPSLSHLAHCQLAHTRLH
eukprot:2467425-Pleurochrysis_carterae.AAC.1